ncbi:MAG: preprotein translocase subunit SecG [Desulfobacterales bacterium]|jgi:preprotein translocase subunit SecG|nr:preprotein translocase subunit SecG [Desulfobacterales bacterium]
MATLLVVIHITICIALIMIVLLQTGKGADMGAAFGGGGSQTLFGSGGASTFLSKLTTAAAIAFMLTSFALAFISSNRVGTSLVIDSKPAVEKKAETSAPENVKATDSATEPPVGTQSSEAESKK